MKTISQKLLSRKQNCKKSQRSPSQTSFRETIESATVNEFRTVISRIAAIKANWTKEEKALRRRLGEARRRQLLNLVGCKSA